MRRSGPFNAETRRRSGYKQSNTERIERFEHRRQLREGSDPRVKRRFAADLQEALGERLQRIGVAHRFQPPIGDSKSADRITFDVTLREAPYTVGIQVTTRRGERQKESWFRKAITDFLHSAVLRGEHAAPRVYLEVVDRVGLRVNLMAERVAHAVRDIVEDIDSWMERSEVGRAIGLRLELRAERKTELFCFRLLRAISDSARGWIESLLHPPEPEPLPEPAVVAPPEPATTPANSPMPERRLTPRYGPPPAFTRVLYQVIAAVHSRRPQLAYVPVSIPLARRR